jgi:tRNA (uracil-5-)-methyltransferase
MAEAYAFAPESYQAQLDEKTKRLETVLAPFGPPPPQVFASPTEHFRMRAEFRLWHEGDDMFYAMFGADKRKPLRVETFPIASQQINRLMPLLLAYIHPRPALRHRLFQVEFLTALSGEGLVSLVYHRPLDEAWEKEAQGLARHLGVECVGRSRRQRLVPGRDYITEHLEVGGRTYTYRQIENSFTQPNARINSHMLDWARQNTLGLEGDLLELYCGNGNFTVVLAGNFGRVLATEISKTSVRAAAENLRLNDIDNVRLARLSSAEAAQALRGDRPFRRLPPDEVAAFELRTLLVDPPRAGLDADTLELARHFERVLYISCNPDALARDLKALGFRIDRLALFDQFPYTHHLECGALLCAPSV